MANRRALGELQKDLDNRMQLKKHGNTRFDEEEYQKALQFYAKKLRKIGKKVKATSDVSAYPQYVHLARQISSASRYSISSITGPHDNLPPAADENAILNVDLCEIPDVTEPGVRTDPCAAVLSFFSASHNRWRMVALVQKGNGTTRAEDCGVVRYDPRRDEWRGVPKRESSIWHGLPGWYGDSRSASKDMDFTLFFPSNPEEVVIDSDRQRLYLLDQHLRLDLVSKEWSYRPLLPPIWNVAGSVTKYVSFPLHELHGLFHHDKDYGLRHVMIDGDNKVISSHIDPKRRFKGCTLIYCEWFQRLYVFGGQSIERKWEYKTKKAKNGELKKLRMCYRPTVEELEKWPENKAIYYCDIGEHRTERKSKSPKSKNGKNQKTKRVSFNLPPLPPQKPSVPYQWRKSKQSVGSLSHSKMRALVVFDHIAIIFLFYGKEEFIGVYCWDLITKKKYKSTKYIDFECGHLDDLQIVKMSEFDIHLLDLRTRRHVVVNSLDIIPEKLKRRCAQKYSALVSGWCGKTKLGKRIEERIGKFLFSLCALSGVDPEETRNE